MGFFQLKSTDKTIDREEKKKKDFGISIAHSAGVSMFQNIFTLRRGCGQQTRTDVSAFNYLDEVRKG